MTFRCLISGCLWSATECLTLGGEVLCHAQCRRCGAHRYGAWRNLQAGGAD
ncbi:PSPA7_2676 family Cys-rich small protein [Pseudomonas jinjuensis]|uniref:PSPA7_2676 family Cys-rich small protein n=1 Tax=Pseudomonas jinjuensis TaxID=198616 RepID=UPI00111342C6|nr:PSPA7_2676 family Cys-rich small protein [Pseudomonas jinjuensis]